MSTAQRVIKNTIWLYIRMGVSILVNIFTTRILLEALGASDFGLYNVVGGAITMLGFLKAALTPATQRYLNYAEGEGDRGKVVKIFNNAIVIHRGLALFTIIFLAAAGFFFFNGILNIPEGRGNVAMAVYACMLISTVYSITIAPYEAVINAHENMRFYSILGIGDVLFKLAIAISVSIYGYDKLLFYAILMAVESWLLRYVTQIYCQRHYAECKKTEIRKYFDRQTIREMTSFAGWIMTGTITSMISLFGMNVVVNHYFGTEVNAAMGIATQLSGVIMAVSMNMIKALTPVLVKKEGGNQHSQMLDISYTGCKFSFMLFSFICIPVLLWLPFVLDLWLHKVPVWTTIFCFILIIGSLLEQLTMILTQSILAKGNIKDYNLSRSCANIMPIILSIAAFEFLDLPPYWALLLWCLFRYVVGGVIIVNYAIKLVEVKLSVYTKRVLAPCLFVSLAVSILGYAIKYAGGGDGILVNIISIVIMILISIPVYWAIALNVKERLIIKGIIMKVIRK